MSDSLFRRWYNRVSVIDLIRQHRSQIDDVCRRYGVRRLELFGSALTNRFDPRTSDVDLLVLYDTSGSLADDEQYFGMLEELEKLLGRKVDLVDIRAARNPYFIAGALKDRALLYAA
jgi:predicted nucleotidyltransferase